MTMDFKILRDLIGPWPGTISVIRTVSGISLPVRCFLADGHYVGSCTYDDLCDIIRESFRYFENVCLDEDDDEPYCVCPFNIPASLPGVTTSYLPYSLPEFSETIFSYLATGDFDVTIEFDDSVGYVGCLNLKFSTKKLY